MWVSIDEMTGIQALERVSPDLLCLPFISSGVHQERRPVRRHW